jgi:hypothetical protein
MDIITRKPNQLKREGTSKVRMNEPLTTILDYSRKGGRVERLSNGCHIKIPQ